MSAVDGGGVIAVVGAGRVGSTLAAGLSRAGHSVVIGARHPELVEPPPGIRVSAVESAVASAGTVFNALPGEVAVAVLSGVRDELAGAVLVDVANATRRADDDRPDVLLYPGRSLAEVLAEALPDTAVVKTLNTMMFSVMTAPESLPPSATVFVSGDEAAAKRTVTGLLGDLGWQPRQIVDLGDVTTARVPEAMMLLVPTILRTRGMRPFAFGIAEG